LRYDLVPLELLGIDVETTDFIQVKRPHRAHGTFPDIVTSVDVHLVIKDEARVVSASFRLPAIDTQLIPVEVVILLLLARGLVLLIVA